MLERIYEGLPGTGLKSKEYMYKEGELRHRSCCPWMEGGRDRETDEQMEGWRQERRE